MSMDEETLEITDGFTPAEVEARTGYLRDYISGQQVKATPEEVEAVQVFARRLVEDYGYAKGQIQTRPQHRVRRNPSDEEKSYPTDIAIFKDSEHKTEDDLFMLVECKKKTRKDGIAQLKIYMDMSRADIGVWFNGEEHHYLRKIYQKNGSIAYKELPAIPRQGQRIEDIGLYLRRDLRRPSNLKAVFRDLRNHLAGNTTGMTRDEAFAQEIINLLFCKIYDEVNTAPDKIVTFRSGLDESAADVKARIVDLFENKVKGEYEDVFSAKDGINLDADSILYIVGELQNYSVTEAERDAVGDAFEVFIGPALRGSEGQFFTPRNVVKMMIDILDPQPGEMLIDPSCGSGGFLIMALEHVWGQVEVEAKQKNWNDVQKDRRKRDVATRFFRGLDKDSFLAKVTKAYMAIIGDGRGGVFCENSLLPPSEWGHATQDKIKLGSFDVILTNPPFGAKIPVRGTSVLSQYSLGHKWARDKATGVMQQGAALHDDQPPQILFLERCLQLLKPGGRVGIVLPESTFGMPTYEYVVTYLRQRTKIFGVVSMPEALFKTSGKGGTHAKVCTVFIENTPPTPGEDYDIFMAEAKWCGHDSRGNPTIRANDKGEAVLLDDVPTITAHYFEVKNAEAGRPASRLGFKIASSSLTGNILIPKYYDPDVAEGVNALADTHDLISVQSLIENKMLAIVTGDEIGKMAYGTGTIPFVRTSDISNWEIKTDPKQGVSEAIYQQYAGKHDVKTGDILFVRDGTYLIGTAAMVSAYDGPMLYQSHLLKLRLSDKAPLTAPLLLAVLSSPPVRRQIRAKQFTADIIDSIGHRFNELILPIPKDEATRDKISIQVQQIIDERGRLRELSRRMSLEVAGVESPSEEDDELP